MSSERFAGAARRLVAYVDADNACAEFVDGVSESVLANRPYLAALVADLRDALAYEDDLARRGVAAVHSSARVHTLNEHASAWHEVDVTSGQIANLALEENDWTVQ